MIIFCFSYKESSKYFEDENGFVYKKVNENEKTVYFDCFNAPRCLVASRYYKQTSALRLFGNHSEFCPPDSKIKMTIHFEEQLKKDVLAEENAAVSVLNVYKRAIEERYESIWLPPNHQKTFLLVLRRLRDYNKTKPKKSKGVVMGTKNAATSPVGSQTPANQTITPANSANAKSSECMATTSYATESKDQNEAATTSDMGTSPMQNMNANASAETSHTGIVEDQQNIPLNTAKVDTPLSIASLSLSTPKTVGCSANKEVNFNFQNRTAKYL